MLSMGTNVRYREFLYVATLCSAMLAGCSGPPAAPPPDAPWLDVKQQIELTKQNDVRLRTLAVRNLGNLGAQAAEAIPRLETLASDPNPKVSEHAREALAKIKAATGQTSDE
jgi:hypothetical protein